MSKEEATRALSGRDIVVFGDISFTNFAKPELEEYGLNVVTAESLYDAINKAGDEFVELHCKGFDDDVIQAYKPLYLVLAIGYQVPSCDKGIIFVGYDNRTTDKPALKIKP